MRPPPETATRPPAPAPPTRRRETRVETVRVVEYTHFPRTGLQSGPRIGFTRDVSPSGLCLGAGVAEPVGALIRLTLRELDGRPSPAGVGRVAWCRGTRGGRYWIGLEKLLGT